jgi:hypothetical protein
LLRKLWVFIARNARNKKPRWQGGPAGLGERGLGRG